MQQTVRVSLLSLHTIIHVQRIYLQNHTSDMLFSQL
nr:MAG TPA: hypothetical protein [Caudoviricetes sp.]